MDIRFAPYNLHLGSRMCFPGRRGMADYIGPLKYIDVVYVQSALLQEEKLMAVPKKARFMLVQTDKKLTSIPGLSIFLEPKNRFNRSVR